jgi:hypothetical protein
MQHPIETITSWKTKSFFEQLANLSSEVYRSLSWREKGDKEYSLAAFYRSLELIDITLDCKLTKPEFKELCRLRDFGLTTIFLITNMVLLKSTGNHIFISSLMLTH